MLTGLGENFFDNGLVLPWSGQVTPGSPNSEGVFTAGCTSQALSDKDLITQPVCGSRSILGNIEVIWYNF